MNELQRISGLIIEGVIRITPQPPWAKYATGRLRDNIIDKTGIIVTDNSASFSMLNNPIVHYGIILNNAPTIRRRIRTEPIMIPGKRKPFIKSGGYRSTFIRTQNIHYHFLDNFFNNEAVSIVERELGVKKI